MKAKRKSKDWIYFAIGYFHASDILLQSKLQGEESEANVFNNGHLFAAIYSIKHGIELLLKTLNVQISNDFGDTHHNIEKHHDAFLKELDRQFGGYKHKLPDESITKLTELIDKFVWNRFLETLTRETVSGIKDSDNTLFRYPETNIGMLGVKVFKDCTREQLNELHKDVNDLIKVCLEIATALYDLQIKKLEHLMKSTKV